jgi:hypothetical protein
MAMQVDGLEIEYEPPVAPETGNGTAPLPDWRKDKKGQDFVAARGRSGIVIRQGDETVEQAYARDERERGRGGDKRPRRKTKRPPMPDAPKKVDLKELETTLAEALKAPGMLAASFGDEWAADHFATSGPYLARNLILASEHNPWLRKKLEEAATGQDAMMKVVSLVGVGGALFAYAIPPIIYWFNLPAPAKTREMFGIPPRKERDATNAATAPPAPFSAGSTQPVAA